jgi:hypothetical protein
MNIFSCVYVNGFHIADVLKIFILSFLCSVLHILPELFSEILTILVVLFRVKTNVFIDLELSVFLVRL